MELYNMRKNNMQNTYTLEGTIKGRHPKYLKIIEYVNNNRNKEFTREELLVNSGYKPYYQGSDNLCYLTAAFNANKIISYNKSKRIWTIGENFDSWCKEYYPELNSSRLETYNCEFLTKKYSENRTNISKKDLADKGITGTNQYVLVNMMIEGKLRQIEKLVQEIRDLLN